jgi:hypothetical protein
MEIEIVSHLPDSRDCVLVQRNFRREVRQGVLLVPYPSQILGARKHDQISDRYILRAG